MEQKLLTVMDAIVQIDQHTCKPIETTIGTPLGDSLSPILFVCYLESALRDVRAHIPPRPTTGEYIRTETEYTDDVTFISTSTEYLQKVLPIIKARLLQWHLHVNDSKTEWIGLVLFDKVEEKGVEPWRNINALGSLLGDQQDLNRRMQQAAIAFCRIMTLWLRRQKVSESRQIRLYKSYILPTLTYNIGTWGITNSKANRLDAFHRKQLRFLIVVFYPDHISNTAL